MSTIGPKKDGGPNVEYFQSPECLAQFDQIRVWLQKNCKKHVQTDPPTKEGLAQLVIQLIQYQENKLGKNASDPPFLRLPMKVFMDMKPGGSLCTVLATMFRFKSEQRWRKFDFQVGKNPSRKDLNVQMMMEIESALVSAEVIRTPCVYIRPEVDKTTANKVKDIISHHQGEICEDEEDATHIIYPTVDPLEEEYARPVCRRGAGVLVHWYYFPDSHDTWAQADMPIEVPETANWECNRSEPWRVTATWALDLPQYNEWMNEEDYEVDAGGKKKVHKLRLSVDDLIPGSEPSSKSKKSKRKRSPSPPPLKHGKRKSRISKRRDNDADDEEDNASRDNTDAAPTPDNERATDINKYKNGRMKLRNPFYLKHQRTKLGGQVATVFVPCKYEGRAGFLPPFIQFGNTKANVVSPVESPSTDECLTTRTRTTQRQFRPNSSRDKTNQSIQDTCRQDMDETDLFFLSMSKELKKLPKLEQVKIKLDLYTSIAQAIMRQLETPPVKTPQVDQDSRTTAVIPSPTYVPTASLSANTLSYNSRPYYDSSSSD